MQIERTVRTDRPIGQVFDYLSDFTHTTDWDPGTVHTEKTSGDGGVGTIYHNVSTFMGRETELEYTVIDLVPNQRFALRGVNKSVSAQDTMTFRSVGDGTEVTYVAAFEFSGIAKFLGPLIKPGLNKLGDKAESGMRTALAKL